MKFLNIQENSAGRLNRDTPGDIQGLCVKRLVTCTAIIIFGKQGVSVIHDEGFLSIDSISEEFASVGDIQSWYIFYNPNKLTGDKLSSRIDEMTPLIVHDAYKAYYRQPDSETTFSPTESGFVAVDHAARDFVLTSADHEIVNSKYFDVRFATRMLNNLSAYCLAEGKPMGHRQVPVDLLFDGKNEVSPSCLIASLPDISKFIDSTFHSRDDRIHNGEYHGYMSKAKQNPSLDNTFPPPQQSDSFHSQQSACSLCDEYYEKLSGNPDLQTKKACLKMIALAKRAIDETSDCYEASYAYEAIVDEYQEKIAVLQEQKVLAAKP